MAVLWGGFVRAVRVPQELVDDLTSQGRVDDAAKYWAKRIKLTRYSDATLRRELYETGIERERIDDMTRQELVAYVLFVLAGYAEAYDG